MSVNLELIERLVRSESAESTDLRLAPHTPNTTELPADIDDWPAEWREEFEERAAIMEFDGSLNRQEAEAWAETIVRAAYRLRQKDGGLG